MSKKIIIGVSGNIGSFSEEAANYYCRKHNIKNKKLEYLVGVDNVLNALENNKADLGIFPLENSNGGIVIETVYAMSKYIINIKDLFEIDIKMNLLVKPGTAASRIKKIISHPQALKQCRMYLKRRWKDVDLEEYVDTASAAQDLSLGKLSAVSVVIAPKICAKLYGLDLLEESIQDLKFNYTTFIAATNNVNK
ncbi:hypothetical protein DRH27_04905 [Candidatus Falkowbacteria bacterium]|nr:MAG: hypothetical protein DRH27_04905 [Candidatus Falkowbacteria bacterium]